MTETATGEQGTRWQRRSEARPGEILAAASHLFVERGYAATRMEEIAAEAGVTKGTLYLYFKSKEDLFRAMVEDSVLPRLEAAESAAAEATGSAPEQFRRLMLEWWERASTPPTCGLAKLMSAEAANFPGVARYYVEEVLVRSRRVFEQVLERGMASGEFRQVNAADAVRVALAPMVWALVYQHSLGVYDPSGFDPRALIELHVDIFLRGLEAGSGADEANG